MVWAVLNIYSSATFSSDVGGHGINGDFDVVHISWRPDYDIFFYHQLAKRVRRQFLFREEFLFELQPGVLAETPELGHATYLFAGPRTMESFLSLYARVSKENIYRNWENVAGRLGLLGRIVHALK